ncbi:hypothetical protein Tco_0292221 [Tanacetum coccineum]
MGCYRCMTFGVSMLTSNLLGDPLRSRANLLLQDGKWMGEHYVVSLRLFHERCEMIKIKAVDLKSKEIEITSSEGNIGHGYYEELFVLVIAETYDKVDAVVSLIELPITPKIYCQPKIEKLIGKGLHLLYLLQLVLIYQASNKKVFRAELSWGRA